MLADIVKIHCLSHRANFPMSRTSRVVVCKEGKEEHVLCNNFPSTGSWIYCCNCQTFISWETGRTDVSVKECPFCLSSLNARLYACDHCAITMLDFDDQTLQKHHAVLSWGMPQPACPGCHQFPSSTPKIHFCHILQSNLATARPNCPFCNVDLEDLETDGVKTITARLDAALAEAQARASEAEERRRLAEETARKEIELRVQAERKADEIEKKVTLELIQPETELLDPALVMHHFADHSANGNEEIARPNTIGSQGPTVTVAKKNKVYIALYAAIATFLFLAFIMLLITMFRLYYSLSVPQ